MAQSCCLVHWGFFPLLDSIKTIQMLLMAELQWGDDCSRWLKLEIQLQSFQGSLKVLPSLVSWGKTPFSGFFVPTGILTAPGSTGVPLRSDSILSARSNCLSLCCGLNVSRKSSVLLEVPNPHVLNIWNEQRFSWLFLSFCFVCLFFFWFYCPPCQGEPCLILQALHLDNSGPTSKVFAMPFCCCFCCSLGTW